MTERESELQSFYKQGLSDGNQGLKFNPPPKPEEHPDYTCGLSDKEKNELKENRAEYVRGYNTGSGKIKRY